jgi:hypothetical protein
MELIKFEYKKECVGHRACHNHFGRQVEYTLRPKSEGGRFDFGSGSYGLCKECFNDLPDIDITREFEATKHRFAKLIAFLRQPGNEDLEYEKMQVDAYCKRLALLREYAEQTLA